MVVGAHVMGPTVDGDFAVSLPALPAVKMVVATPIGTRASAAKLIAQKVRVVRILTSSARIKRFICSPREMT